MFVLVFNLLAVTFNGGNVLAFYA
jgi:hypothetical protein